MPRKRKIATRYLEHKQSGRGRLVWNDSLGVRHEKLLPGLFESEESLAARARLESEIAASPNRALSGSSPNEITIAELLSAFLDHAEGYYLDLDGKQTKEVVVLKYAMKTVRELYARSPASEFGPLALKAVRKRMIELGLSRCLINRRISAIKRIFKWAASEELIKVGVYDALKTVAGLERGRTQAREAKPVLPVNDETVQATLPFLPNHVRVMIDLMWHTGMRPAEVCSMTLNQIEQGSLWTYRPARHKTAHRGLERIIPLGPKARAILSSFLAGRTLTPDEPIFSPKRAREERFVEMRSRRKSKVQPSQVSRKKKRNTSRMPADRYCPEAISHAVTKACDKAFPPPGDLAQRKSESFVEWWGGKLRDGKNKGKHVEGRLSDEQRDQLNSWRLEHRWNPYRLRHAFGTRVRRDYGLEASQVLLGHSRANVTEVYAQRNQQLATTVAQKIG